MNDYKFFLGAARGLCERKDQTEVRLMRVSESPLILNLNWKQRDFRRYAVIFSSVYALSISHPLRRPGNDSHASNSEHSPRPDYGLYLLPKLWGSKIFGEVTDSNSRAQRVQDDPGTSCYIKD